MGRLECLELVLGDLWRSWQEEEDEGTGAGAGRQKVQEEAGGGEEVSDKPLPR